MVHVDEFRSIDLLQKEKLEKSIWISPVTYGSANEKIIQNVLDTNEIGLAVDIRIANGTPAPGRNNPNWYAIVEFSDTNSVNRSLNAASKGRAIFAGQKARIYRAGTQTAILQPKQARRR